MDKFREIIRKFYHKVKNNWKSKRRRNRFSEAKKKRRRLAIKWEWKIISGEWLKIIVIGKIKIKGNWIKRFYKKFYLE